MKTFQFILVMFCLPALILVSCGKDDDGDDNGGNNANSEIAGTWLLKKLEGTATYTNGTSPYQVTNAIKDELPVDMTSYNQTFKFETSGKCVMDGDNGTFTYKDKVLTTNATGLKMVFTVLSVDAQSMKLQMDNATSKVYAIEVADAVLKEAGDPKTCKVYGITATDASFTVTLSKK